MDLQNFGRALRGVMDRPENFNDLVDGEPLNLKHGEDHAEGANTGQTESDPSADAFAAATAEEVYNQRDCLLDWDFCHGIEDVEGANAELTEPVPSAAVFEARVAAEAPISYSLLLGDCIFDDDIREEMVAMEEMDREFESRNNVDRFLSYSDQQQGIEHPADDGNQADNDLEETTATHEHGSNNFADSRVSSIHRRNHRAGDAEAMASSQLVSTHSYNHGKDEFDHIRNQKHSLINHKSSQGASCATLPEGISDEDETQSTSAANIDGEEIVSEPKVPSMGMEFSSVEAVYNFYNIYANQSGFKVRKGKAEYNKNKEMKSKYFLCTRQGLKSQKQIDKPTRYKKPNTRTDCRARIKCVRDDGTWKISEVFLDHNHPVAPRRAEDSCATTRTLLMDKTVNKVKTVGEQALVSDADCCDISRGRWKNHPMPEPEDTQDLINYFKIRQIGDPFFFHTAQVKAASMENFFWRDSRSKIDYEHFGDVLVLDTITRINKYDMICAVFWGLNNHRQRIIFGCAFLVDRTVDSLNWLLRSFLEAMRCHKPKTIITEVSKEITDALREVLPETSHCLSFWSILSGFRKNLSALGDRPSVDLLECIFNVHSQEKFKLKWNSFVGTYMLRENTWIASLYGMREKWSHAFTKNVFSAGIISIQNNEYASGIFENLSCETMTLSQIAQWCENMAKQMRQKEFVESMRCKKITSNLQSEMPVEKEAVRLYTRPIFKMFQKESRNILLLAIEEIGGMAPVREFKLTKEGSTEFNIVKFDSSNSTLVCSCGKFESVGILCFHALKVLNFMNIFEIPSRYLLKRWTKSAKDSLPVDAPSIGPARGGGPVDSFIGEFMRKALHVAHMSVNKERESTAMRFIDSMLEHIAKAPKTEEVAAACPRAKRKVGGDRRAGKRASLVPNALAH
ncbi:hypothetical protein NL676_030611 [Syzygium grande]|nr:hypothetical protein NL676_030611 [Syzygium grande]